jgi:hypothetical protein
MRQTILISLVISSALMCRPALADNYAVNHLNVDLSPSLFVIQDVENGIDLAAEMTFPLGPVLGVGLLADVGVASGKDGYLDSVTTGIGGEIFLGHYDIGRVGFGILTGDQVYSDDGSYFGGDITVSSESVVTYAEVYLGDFTLGVASSGNESEIDYDGDYSYDQPESDLRMFELQYYPTDNIRLEVSWYTEKIDDGIPYYGTEDTEIEGQSLGLEFQLGSMVSIFMEYDTNEDNDAYDAEKTKSYSVGATVYFSGGGDTLKDNDRWY